MARHMWGLGVSLGTITCLPLRYRFGRPEARIRLRCGIVMTAPWEEPLLELVGETWAEMVYGSTVAERGQTIMDIGANVGVFTLFAASRSPHASIIAIEPTPRSYGYLCSNARSNKLSNVIPVQAACGATQGRATIYRRGSEAMNCLYPGGTPLFEVDVLTLDNLFVRFQIESCRLLKLDCEGAEYDILYAACAGTLAAIAEIRMEYHVGINRHHPEELSRFLQSHGFPVDCRPMLDDETGYLHARRT